MNTFYSGGPLHRHWGHFLVETLSRLWILFDYRCPNWDKIVFTSPTPDIHSFHSNISEAFALLGISDKIKIIDKPARYAQVIEPIQCIKPREKVFAECTSVYDRIASAVQIPEDYGPFIIYPNRIFRSFAKNHGLKGAEAWNEKEKSGRYNNSYVFTAVIIVEKST